MTQIIYEIVTGTPDFTASVFPAESPPQVHNSLGVYSFDGLPDQSYRLTVVDANGCSDVHVICGLSATLLDEFPSTTTTTTGEPTTITTTTTTVGNEPFIFEVIVGDESVTLPLISGYTFDFTVDWGDGSPVGTVTTYDDVDATHVYLSGTYIITITGICQGFSFASGSATLKTKIDEVVQWGNMSDFRKLDFSWCSNLTTIPNSSITAVTNLGTCAYMFNRTGLTGNIPSGLFDNAVNITGAGFDNTFAYCSGLTGAIPADLFRYNTNITAGGIFEGAFSYTFADCSNLTSIPNDLFRYNTLVSEYAFVGTFVNCFSITTIPVDLFRYNTLVSTDGFGITFNTCIGITSVPVDLFRYNTEVIDGFVGGFNGTFIACSSLETVPYGLFKYNTSNTLSFNQCFKDCNKLQFNPNTFYEDGEQSTRFLNKNINFSNCFIRDSFTGIQGEAPDLWNCDYGTGSVDNTDCFQGAGNSLTSISNYCDIPPGPSPGWGSIACSTTTTTTSP